MKAIHLLLPVNPALIQRALLDKQRTMKKFLMLLLPLFVLPGCETIPEPSPMTAQERTVRLIAESTRTVVIPKELKFYDNEEPARGIHLPPGEYLLEAEDDEYYYYLAPERISFRMMIRTIVADEQNLPGGLMLSKEPRRNNPAAIYLQASGTMRILTWKLDQRFMNREGEDWSRSGN